MGIYSSISPFLELPSAALAGAGCWPRRHLPVQLRLSGHSLTRRTPTPPRSGRHDDPIPRRADRRGHRRGLAADVADEAAVDAAITQVESRLPPIVGLANIAGVSSPTEFLDVTPAEWDRVFDINMRGTFLVTRRVARGMVDRGLGRIVSVSSISAQRGGGTYSKVPYSASKAAIIGFTRALAREMGPHGITVNCIAPGPVDTDIMGGTLTEDRKAAMSADMPVGRVGTVDEIAALMVFLLGADAGYITAATYDINGGLQVS